MKFRKEVEIENIDIIILDIFNHATVNKYFSLPKYYSKYGNTQEFR